MSHHRKRRNGLVERLPRDVSPGVRPARRCAHGGVRWVALTAVGVVLTGAAAAWSLGPSRGPGRPRVMTMASAAAPVAGPLMSAITLADESGLAKGQLPPATCRPDSTTMVTCVAPAPGIIGVVLSTYPSLPALYTAYVARVETAAWPPRRSAGRSPGTTSSSILATSRWRRWPRAR